ncbi:hypothetical protein RB195_001316 [Necator americanus]
MVKTAMCTADREREKSLKLAIASSNGYMKSKSNTQSRTTRCEDVILRSQCYKWFQRFENGSESLKDEEHRRRPQVIDDELLKKAIESDPTQTTRKLALEFGCSNSTVDEHLHTIGNTNGAANGFLIS